VELAGLRQDVAFLREQYQVSERRACKLLLLDRTTYRYEPRPDHNAQLREKMTELAKKKPRYGYRRLHVLLERQGEKAGPMRLFRL
jgi:putative transposase